MTPRDHLNMPGREFVLTREDIGRYSDLLVEAFPDVRFFDSYPSKKEGPPELAIRHSLRECGDRAIEIVFAAADWVPEWKRSESTGWWLLANCPGFNGRFEAGCEIYTKKRVVDGEPRELEYIYGGRVYFRCRKWAPEELKAARKALRLLTKVATNKVVATRWPSGDQPNKCPKGSWTWCGYDALRWVSEHPDRRLACWRAPRDEFQGDRPLGA